MRERVFDFFWPFRGMVKIGFDPYRCLDYSIEIALGQRVVNDRGMIGCRFYLFLGMNLPRFLRCTYDMPMAWYLKGWRHPADWTGREAEIVGLRWERAAHIGWYRDEINKAYAA